MGTLLHDQGISFEKCFDELNLTNPAIVAGIHQSYIDAGSQIILTNTFGANRYKLERHGLSNSIKDINSAAVDLARRVVAASFKPVWSRETLGRWACGWHPSGVYSRMKPARYSRSRSAFCWMSKVDLLVIETVTDLFEVREAIFAAREISADIPIIASMTFTRDDRTLLGDSPRKVAHSMREFGADIIGVNCSGGPEPASAHSQGDARALCRMANSG